MQKAKKYIYPFVFSIAFLVFYISFVLILTKVLSFPRGSYAPAAWAVLFALAWVLIVVPIYCIIYSKIIIKEKYKFLFLIYNCAVLFIIHILPFNLQGEESIAIAFFAWTMLCNGLSLAVRIPAEKKTEKDAESEIQD